MSRTKESNSPLYFSFFFGTAQVVLLAFTFNLCHIVRLNRIHLWGGNKKTIYQLRQKAWSVARSYNSNYNIDDAPTRIADIDTQHNWLTTDHKHNSNAQHFPYTAVFIILTFTATYDCAYSARCGAENDCALLWIIWPMHSLNMAALLYVEVFFLIKKHWNHQSLEALPT